MESLYFVMSLSKLRNAYCIFGSDMLTLTLGSSMENWIPTSSAKRCVQTRLQRYLSVGAASGDDSRMSMHSVMNGVHLRRFVRCRAMATLEARK